MTLKNKIIATLSGIGILSGFTFVGLDQACIFDAEILQVESEKLCFDKQEDYLTFKNHLIGEYKKYGAIIFWDKDGYELLAVINHEIKKKEEDIITLGNVSEKNLVDAIIEQID